MSIPVRVDIEVTGFGGDVEVLRVPLVTVTGAVYPVGDRWRANGYVQVAMRQTDDPERHYAVMGEVEFEAATKAEVDHLLNEWGMKVSSAIVQAVDRIAYADPNGSRG